MTVNQRCQPPVSEPFINKWNEKFAGRLNKMNVNVILFYDRKEKKNISAVIITYPKTPWQENLKFSFVQEVKVVKYYEG